MASLLNLVLNFLLWNLPGGLTQTQACTETCAMCSIRTQTSASRITHTKGMALAPHLLTRTHCVCEEQVCSLAAGVCLVYQEAEGCHALKIVQALSDLSSSSRAAKLHPS